jgi:hypothetical protein
MWNRKGNASQGDGPKLTHLCFLFDITKVVLSDVQKRHVDAIFISFKVYRGSFLVSLTFSNK